MKRTLGASDPSLPFAVSYEVPSLHPMYQIPVGPGEGNHTVGFTAAAALPESHRLTLEAAKGIAVGL